MSENETVAKAATETVTIETNQSGREYYVVGGKDYWIHPDEQNTSTLLEISRHYALIAEYLESPEQKEHQRLETRRSEITKRYGIDPRSPYSMTAPVKAMVEDILKFEEASK